MSMEKASSKAEPERLYKVKELATAMGVRSQDVYKLIYAGRLKAVDMGVSATGRRRWRISHSNYVRFIEGK